MPSLEVLNLEGNHFRVLDIVTQMALSSLPQLKVSHQNWITDFPLYQLFRLQILNLANNQLTDLDDDAVRNLKNLKEINLSQNDLDFVPDTLAYVGASLERLNVDDNPIRELTDGTFISKYFPRFF